MDINNLYRKLNEYNIIKYKMSGYLADYFLDRAIESNDFSEISTLLIDLFSGANMFDVNYLVSTYKQFGLNKKIEDLDLDVNEWYLINKEIEKIKNEKNDI